MGFLSGLVTGAAQSIDAQLKKDIERSQERAEGMAQYRITRRRAEIERQEKEKRDLEKTLGNLASLVDGDIDKAAQLYMAGGQNVEGANSLYQELLKNKQAGVDVQSALSFATEIAEPGQMQDYISKFITPVTTLPAIKGEVTGAGLYGALFKPDMSAEVMKRVEEAAPITPVEKPDMEVQMAGIDRSKFISAVEYSEARQTFATAEEKAQHAMQMADNQYQLAVEREAREGESQETRDALAIASGARDQARLDLSIAQSKRQAEESKLSMDLSKLSLEEKQMEINKAKNAPEFATFELMLVATEQKIAEELTRPPEQQNRNTLNILEKQRAHALKGISDVALAKDTGTTTPTFSRQSVDSIINAEIKRQLQPVGLVQDIEGQITYSIEGNELQYFDRMSRALTNVEYRTAGLNDAQMNKTIEAQRNSLTLDAQNYVKKQLAGGATPIMETDRETILDKAFDDGAYKAGDIIQYEENGVVKHVLWTGSDIF